MKPATAKLWAAQNRHEGDRRRFFTAVADAIDATTVLYPGSYVDVAASFVWPDVTYVDVDRRATRFFADVDGVREIVAAQVDSPADPRIEFLATDYTTDLPLEPDYFDLLLSLYTGPVSLHCTRYLRIGGWLLAHPSHGDVALASIDDRYELAAVVDARSNAGTSTYDLSIDGLDDHLVPKPTAKNPAVLTVESILRFGRGVAYTKSAFAYLFRRVS